MLALRTAPCCWWWALLSWDQTLISLILTQDLTQSPKFTPLLTYVGLEDSPLLLVVSTAGLGPGLIGHNPLVGHLGLNVHPTNRDVWGPIHHVLNWGDKHATKDSIRYKEGKRTDKGDLNLLGGGGGGTGVWGVWV